MVNWIVKLVKIDFVEYGFMKTKPVKNTIQGREITVKILHELSQIFCRFCEFGTNLWFHILSGAKM